MAKLKQSYACSKCAETITDSEELVESRGYLWHKPCYNEEFPGTGKAVPETILSNREDGKNKDSVN